VVCLTLCFPLFPYTTLFRSGIEAGGTKFVCGVGTGPDDLRTAEFATTTPEATVGEAIAFFQGHADQLEAIGIASFGPVDPRPQRDRKSTRLNSSHSQISYAV